MKIAINTRYGGFELPDDIYLQLSPDFNPYLQKDRTDPKLISLIEERGGSVKTYFSNVIVVDIPDEATDWIIEEYDGAESIIYVLDGKLHIV